MIRRLGLMVLVGLALGQFLVARDSTFAGVLCERWSMVVGRRVFIGRDGMVWTSVAFRYRVACTSIA
jgi:hypothetical protein